MAKNEFPLSVPPPANLDVGCQTYVQLVFDNLENGGLRAYRQWSIFRPNDVEVPSDSKGNPLSCPGTDRVIPPFPSGLALRRPRFWLELFESPTRPGETKTLSLSSLFQERPKLSLSQK